MVYTDKRKGHRQYSPAGIFECSYWHGHLLECLSGGKLFLCAAGITDPFHSGGKSTLDYWAFFLVPARRAKACCCRKSIPSGIVLQFHNHYKPSFVRI